MVDALQNLRLRVQELESDPGVCKRQLVQQVLGDKDIHWDAIFATLKWKGRHRHKKRWRRTLIDSVIRRVYPRGGRRYGCRAPPEKKYEEADIRESSPPGSTSDPKTDAGDEEKNNNIGLHAVAAATEFDALPTEDVWNRFRVVYPILAVYRTGWNPQSPVALRRTKPKDWDGLWSGSTGTAALRCIAHSLDWPAELEPGLHIVARLAIRLWPAHPWSDWMSDDAGAFRRGAIPYLRRAACLLHGFLLGGCNPFGVWEAIQLPTRPSNAPRGEPPAVMLRG